MVKVEKMNKNDELACEKWNERKGDWSM